MLGFLSNRLSSNQAINIFSQNCAMMVVSESKATPNQSCAAGHPAYRTQKGAHFPSEVFPTAAVVQPQFGWLRAAWWRAAQRPADPGNPVPSHEQPPKE